MWYTCRSNFLLFLSLSPSLSQSLSLHLSLPLSTSLTVSLSLIPDSATRQNEDSYYRSKSVWRGGLQAPEERRSWDRRGLHNPRCQRSCWSSRYGDHSMLFFSLIHPSFVAIVCPCLYNGQQACFVLCNYCWKPQKGWIARAYITVKLTIDMDGYLFHLMTYLISI